MILIDTNVLVRFLKGDAVTVGWLQRSVRSELGVSSVTLYELEYGTLKANVPLKRRQRLTAALEKIERVPFDADAAAQAARIRVRLEEEGRVIGPYDLLIAGIAVSRRAKLATYNLGEFERVRGLELVRIS